MYELFSMRRNTIIIELPEKPDFDHPSAVLYFKVDKLPSTVISMKEAGAEFIDEPHMVGKMGDTEVCLFQGYGRQYTRGHE